MGEKSISMTNDEIDKLAADLPRMTMHGRVPTRTIMAMAMRITELLEENARLKTQDNIDGPALA